MTEDSAVFFFDSLIDIFQPTDSALWAFSAYFGGESMEGISINTCDPIYAKSEIALRAAKIHALYKFVLRSQEPFCLTQYPDDLVLAQSDEAIERFGVATNMPASDFYPNRQDRADMIKEAECNGKAERKLLTVTDIDANRFEGYVNCELIKIDSETTLLLERFTLVFARDSLNH